jgi:hypothetical protein
MGVMRAIGRHLANRVKAIVPEVLDTAKAKVAQGASELSNSLYAGQANAYSPYTADIASRSSFQKKDQSKGQER